MILKRLSPALPDLVLDSPKQLREHIAEHSWPEPSFMANLVTTIDGRFWGQTTSSRDLSNAHDLQSLLGYRNASDLILTSATTARQEQYKRSGLAPLALVSRSGNFANIPAVQSDSAGPDTSLVHLFVPSKIAKKTKATYEQPWIRVHKLGKLRYGSFSPFRLSFALTRTGARRVVIEAGPTLVRWLVQSHALQYLSLTIIDAAEQSPLNAAKPALEALGIRGAQLEWAEQVDGTMFTRWSELSA